MIHIMHVLSTGSDRVTKDNLSLTMLIRRMKVFYYWLFYNEGILLLVMLLLFIT